MAKRVRKLFFFILALTTLFVFIDLPENYPINFKIGNIQISRVINPPIINFQIGNIAIHKDFRTRFGLDIAGGSHLVLDADMSGVPEAERTDALESSRQVIERRVNFFGISEPIVQSARSADAYRIIVELPGVTDTSDAMNLIGQTARLEFRKFDESNPESTQAAFLIPTLENTLSVDITGKDLSNALLSFSPETGGSEVSIEFTKEGTEKFAIVTQELLGKQLAIFLDDFPLTWPTVSAVITDGKARITGDFSHEEARRLALQLKAGALPVPVTVIERRTIEATLGADSVRQSVTAGAIGLTIVALFMIANYGYLGLIADLALIVYGLTAFAIFRTIPITLTLPGLAGFILSIGMAVDSNILIFERFKEELRSGKPASIAMELGFGKAWESIRDANFTTILTAIILYNPFNWQFLPTSGLVRGFAATLLIGVLVSLFTGIIVTRTFVRVLYKKALQKDIKAKKI